LCLLLTLLAVPVFYSLFEDAKELRAWSRVGAFFGRFKGGLGRRVSEGYASVARQRGPEPSGGTLSRQKQKDRYADQASGD
jgi:heme A synthase